MQYRKHVNTQKDLSIYSFPFWICMMEFPSFEFGSVHGQRYPDGNVNLDSQLYSPWPVCKDVLADQWQATVWLAQWVTLLPFTTAEQVWSPVLACEVCGHQVTEVGPVGTLVSSYSKTVERPRSAPIREVFHNLYFNCCKQNQVFPKLI